MANYLKLKDQQKEAFKENIFTINWCLTYDKSTEANWDGESKIGCLGVPAAILLFSLIDTIGSFYSGSETEIVIDSSKYKIAKASDHFYILNHESFFNLKLSKTAIEDLYSTYRCKLTHNNSLPANNFLAIGDESSDIFEFDSENKIS